MLGSVPLRPRPGGHTPVPVGHSCVTVEEPRVLLWSLFALAGATFVAVGLKPAPYGRHARPGWGPRVPVRLAWFLMAAPGLALFGWVYAQGARAGRFVPIVMAVLWVLHYGWRALVYPLLLRGTRGKGVPLVIVALGVVVCAGLSYLNAGTIAEWGRAYTLRWLYTVRFIYGLVLFATGFVLVRWADLKLTRLRKRGATDHVLPSGGIFNDVACPNYLGEVIMWIGWAVLTWSQAGLAAAAIAVASLVPRAVSHHLWYRRTFRDYPLTRRAIIPLLL